VARGACAQERTFSPHARHRALHAGQAVAARDMRWRAGVVRTPARAGPAAHDRSRRRAHLPARPPNPRTIARGGAVPDGTRRCPCACARGGSKILGAGYLTWCEETGAITERATGVPRLVHDPLRDHGFDSLPAVRPIRSCCAVSLLAAAPFLRTRNWMLRQTAAW